MAWASAAHEAQFAFLAFFESGLLRTCVHSRSQFHAPYVRTIQTLPSFHAHSSHKRFHNCEW